MTAERSASKGLIALVILLSLVAAPSAYAEPANMQFRCDAATTNEWLLPPPSAAEGEKIDPALVRPVTKDVERAIALLGDRSTVVLTRDELVAFAGTPTFGTPPPSEQYRAYLVRAVFPTRRPTLDIRWSGNDLHVFAGGLGALPS